MLIFRGMRAFSDVLQARERERRCVVVEPNLSLLRAKGAVYAEASDEGTAAWELEEAAAEVKIFGVSLYLLVSFENGTFSICVALLRAELLREGQGVLLDTA